MVGVCARVSECGQVFSRTVAAVDIKRGDMMGPRHSKTLETFCHNINGDCIVGVHYLESTAGKDAKNLLLEGR